MITDDLFGMLKPERLVEVVDIGANPIDGTPPYQELLSKKLCRLTGFEPQLNALKILNEKKGENERYFPFVVGDGKAHNLNICTSSGMTSLLEPDMATLDLFEALKPHATIKNQELLETSRLDDILEVELIDFLKIDTQGSELSILLNSKSKLSRAVCIQLEISFVTLYKDQPPFGEVDVELRKMGFIPHMFEAIKKWPIAPYYELSNPKKPLNQLLEADIVYVKNFVSMSDFEVEQIKHLALIMHHCYKSYDLVLRCIKELITRQLLPVQAILDYSNYINKLALKL